MAVTFAVTGRKYSVFGDRRRVIGTLTATGTTTDNGDAITPAAFGLHTRETLELEPALDSNSNPEASFVGRFIPNASSVVGGVIVFITADGTTGDAVPLTVITDGTDVVAAPIFNFTAFGT
jgi:hypothetical protein